MQIDPTVLVTRNNMEVRQIRLNNIKQQFFIVPSKEAKVEKINLSDCIPFVNSEAPRRDQFL